MKRVLPCLAFILLFAFAASAADIFVSPQGSDANDGTKEKPLATLAAALRKARELRRLNDASVKNGIHIILSGGKFLLTETIVLRSEDAATPDSPTYIEATAGAQPVLAGAVLHRCART